MRSGASYLPLDKRACLWRLFFGMLGMKEVGPQIEAGKGCERMGEDSTSEVEAMAPPTHQAQE